MTGVQTCALPIWDFVLKSAGDGISLFLFCPDNRVANYLDVALDIAFLIRAFFVEAREKETSQERFWMNIRVSLHFGDVFPVKDPITGNLDAVGKDIITGARLEPCVPENMIWATEAFAKEYHWHHSNNGTYRYRNVGPLKLKKSWGSTDVYQFYRSDYAGDLVHIRQYPSVVADVGVFVKRPIGDINMIHISWGPSHCIFTKDMITNAQAKNGNPKEGIVIKHKILSTFGDLPFLNVYVDPPCEVQFIPFAKNVEFSSTTALDVNSFISKLPQEKQPTIVEDDRSLWHKIY